MNASPDEREPRKPPPLVIPAKAGIHFAPRNRETMKLCILLLLVLPVGTLASCRRAKVAVSSNLSSQELEIFLRSHKVNGHHAVGLMKRSLGDASYLATIHGYPNNMSVCEELIKPYNEDPKLSTIHGEYYCEALEQPAI